MDTLREMMVFLHVVDEGSFAGASRRLNLPSSTVRQCMDRLEARLQVRLFERIAGSPLRLTDEGVSYQRASQRVVDAMVEAEGVATAAESKAPGARANPSF